jgi:hypothetical protein
MDELVEIANQAQAEAEAMAAAAAQAGPSAADGANGA